MPVGSKSSNENQESQQFLSKSSPSSNSSASGSGDDNGPKSIESSKSENIHFDLSQKAEKVSKSENLVKSTQGPKVIVTNDQEALSKRPKRYPSQKISSNQR